MKLIIGLGNPGQRYEWTRHNAGFLFLQHAREFWRFPDFRNEPKFSADISAGNIHSIPAILVRPLTFMNGSGRTVGSIARFYKSNPDDIAVVHDDVDIPLGSVRYSFDSRSAGHNGVQDIIDTLGTTAFHRWRIGIRPKQTESETSAPRETADFVLDRFSPDEREILPSVFLEAARSIGHWVVENPE